MKLVQGFFLCLFIIWAFLIVAPQDSPTRARNMCAPVEFVIRVFGSTTKTIDESTGESIARDTSTSVGSSCRTTFAPSVLGSMGLWQAQGTETTAPAQSDSSPSPQASAPAPVTSKPSAPKVAPGMSSTDAL